MIRGSNEYFNENEDDGGVMCDQGSAQIPSVYLLGQELAWSQYEMTAVREASSLFWFTYRDNFPAIQPYGITTDAGWGCMLRSAQMLLAHTLRVHFQSRHWKPKQYQDTFVQTLLTWFADYPSKSTSVYSLHNLCAAGLNYQVLPGEWVGPNTASYVLRDLVELHHKTQPSLFRVHVSSEGTVYQQSVHELMTRDVRKRRTEDNEHQQQQQQQNNQLTNSPQPLHPLDPAPFDENNGNNNNKTRPTSWEWLEEWDTSLLLLIPLRLGLDRFNEDYVQSLARTFALPQSVGVLGGRPRGARWFYGAFANGAKVLGLDPHTIQPTLPKMGNTLDLSEVYRSSYFTRYPEVFDLKRMDPSLALGFYCRDRKDFEALQESLSNIHLPSPDGRQNGSSSKPKTATPPALVSFLDKAPNYENNAMLNEPEDDEEDMFLAGGSDGDNHENELSDEDEYVLL